MTPLQIVEARAPEFEGEARLTDLLVLAETRVASDWGAVRGQVLALLVLHWLTLETRSGGGAPGPVISESEGQLSRSYGWSGVYGFLATTAYGLEIMDMRKARYMGFVNRMTL